MRLALVDDDPLPVGAVRQALRDASYAVDRLQDGQSALAAPTHHESELILLGLGLPGRDGLAVLAALRARGDATSVSIVTARDAVEQRADGLDAGADDDPVTPFAVGELLARMRALCRRRAGSGAPMLTNGTLSLDPTTKTVWIGDVEQALSGREFAVLRGLLVRPGALRSRSDLEDRLYGWGEEVDSNVVEYIIHGLRRKLGAEGIRNVRGLGWRVERSPGAETAA